MKGPADPAVWGGGGQSEGAQSEGVQNCRLNVGQFGKT